MIKLKIKELQNILQKAAESGCEEVKLQLYDNWEAVVKEQQTPSRPVNDYKFDVRYYNTVEFTQQVEGDQRTDELLTSRKDNLLILHVEISDLETLMDSFGMEE